MQTRLAVKRDQEQASSKLAQEASRGGDKPGRTDKAGQVQDRRDGRRSREQGGDAAQAAAAAASELSAKSVRNLGNFMFNLFHKYDASKKYMNMISYMCLSNKFIIKDIMNMKLVLTSDA